MNRSKVLQYVSYSALLLALSGCASTPDTAAKHPVTSTPSSSKPVVKNDAPIPFTANEIKDISAAFHPGSCDLSKLKQQSEKYDLDDTWVNLYERTPQPLSALDDQTSCFLAQSNELYAYSDDFYDESPESLNQSWFKGNIPNDAKITTMRYLTPKALLAQCDPDLGRPVIIDYEKDAKGHISRTILINEDFDPSCLNK